MKTIKIEDEAIKNLEKTIKGFGMSKKGCVNMLLRNLQKDDIFLFMKREINIEWEPVEFEDNDDDFEVEIPDDDDDDDEPYIEEGSDEETQDQEFSPAEIKRKQLELEAIKANFISKEEREDYIDENYRN